MKNNKINKNILEFVNVSKSFGPDKVILNKVNFIIESGKIYALSSPNGSGKSTLMKCCSNISYFSGKIIYNGEIIDSSINGKVVYSPDKPYFDLSNISVVDYLKSVSILKNLNYYDLILKFKSSRLNKFANVNCSELSTGWKKILQLFVELSTNPEIIILDEPLNGLDYDFCTMVINKIKNLANENKIVFISSHNFSHLENLIDRENVIAIKDGNIIFNDSNSSIENFYLKNFQNQNNKEEDIF